MIQDKKTKVQNMFDSIAHRYDLLNHILSAGVDYYWRKRALDLTPINTTDTLLLDVACGTGDFAKQAYKSGLKQVIAADLSLEMLKIYNNKISFSNRKAVQTVAEQMPFQTSVFSHITVAFGVRNFYNIPQAFSEFFRILRPQGCVTILEFGMPKNPLIKFFYSLYFHFVLPLVGRIISGDKGAYTYLPESVEEFDKKIDLVNLLQSAGFTKIFARKLTFGLVTVIIAQKI